MYGVLCTRSHDSWIQLDNGIDAQRPDSGPDLTRPALTLSLQSLGQLPAAFPLKRPAVVKVEHPKVAKLRKVEVACGDAMLVVRNPLSLLIRSLSIP